MSNDRGDSQRWADALRAAAITAQPRPDCPSADEIWGALHLELPPGDRLRIIDHTIECPSCAEAWRLAMEIERADSTRIAAPVRGPSWAQPQTWVGVAAALVLVALGSVIALQWRGPSVDPAVRDPGTDVIRSLVPEAAALPKQEFRLRWSGGPDGTRYDLVVTTPALEVVDEVRGLERPEHIIDANRLAAVPPGSRLLWRVIAHLPDGSTMSSTTFGVTVQ